MEDQEKPRYRQYHHGPAVLEQQQGFLADFIQAGKE